MLGMDIPMINLPVAPGRNLSTMIEVAVRNFLAKKNGEKIVLGTRRRKNQEFLRPR